MSIDLEEVLRTVEPHLDKLFEMALSDIDRSESGQASLERRKKLLRMTFVSFFEKSREKIESRMIGDSIEDEINRVSLVEVAKRYIEERIESLK